MALPGVYFFFGGGGGGGSLIICDNTVYRGPDVCSPENVRVLRLWTAFPALLSPRPLAAALFEGHV